MLPQAKGYLQGGGLGPSAAAYATIGGFLGGVVGIQIVSRILHHYIPSHVVDCDHAHEDVVEDDESENPHSHDQNLTSKQTELAQEQTPLLSRPEPRFKPDIGPRSQSAAMIQDFSRADVPSDPPTRTPTTMQIRPTFTQRVSTFVTGAKASCDEGGPCYGYSDPCGHQCLKTSSRSPSRAPTRVPTRVWGRFSSAEPPRQPSLLRTSTAPYSRPKATRTAIFDEEALAQLSPTSTFASVQPRGRNGKPARTSSHLRAETHPNESTNGHTSQNGSFTSEGDPEDQAHHHHVPENAFLAIGLQTSIAIALHKLPEGFITYATNHANPKLGFTVFMALFIHNITEGFAMALPLYLAISSRWKAMFWSSLLGGVSQPLGAGVAALWFAIAGTGKMAPGDTVYGCMFAITAGIMASVALQLYSESLSLTHNRNLCTAFAFIGIGILGFSFALTA